jgi:hypothetical protein
MKLSYILAAIVSLFIASCKPDADINMSYFEKLHGSWINVSDSPALSYEQWFPTDSGWIGMGATVENGDTVFYENLQIKSEGKNYYYVVNVNGQNHNQSIAFKLQSADSTKVVFENQLHDFPQKIIYQFINSDSMVASVSGMVSGNNKEIMFSFKRQ